VYIKSEQAIRFMRSLPVRLCCVLRCVAVCTHPWRALHVFLVCMTALAFHGALGEGKSSL
jgi:hypothetical protein